MNTKFITKNVTDEEIRTAFQDAADRYFAAINAEYKAEDDSDIQRRLDAHQDALDKDFDDLAEQFGLTYADIGPLWDYVGGGLTVSIVDGCYPYYLVALVEREED